LIAVSIRAKVGKREFSRFVGRALARELVDQNRAAYLASFEKDQAAGPTQGALARTFGAARIGLIEVLNGIAGQHVAAHAEEEQAAHEAQQIVRCGGRALSDLRQQSSRISRGDFLAAH
jgi:hypothetical protein